ncbi:Calx-beta domain-containing protein, partial [Eudoraea sp.]|uniref:Calx-beta domain-containing protein n=1 Tax=Eudoraea sp. TaxID=1979955 RepID=UPI003C751164
MGANLKNIFLFKDKSKKLLKGIYFLGLFLLFVSSGYGQNEISIGTGVTLLEGNSGPTLFSFGLSRTGDVSAAATVDFAVAGSGGNPANGADFTGGTLPIGTATFIAGSAVANVNISVNGDIVVESNETFTVTLSNPSIGSTLGTATSLGTIN